MKLIKNFLLPYIKSIDVFRILIALILSFIGVLCSIRVPFIFKDNIDKILSAHNISKSTIISILLIIILQLVVMVFSDYLLQYTGIQVIFNIRKKVIHQLTKLNKSFFDTHDTGELASILTNDSSSVYTLVTSTFPKFITSSINILLLILSLLLLSYKLTIVLMVSLPIILFSYGPFGKRLGILSCSLQEQIGKLNSYGFSIIDNNSFIKSHSAQKFEISKGLHILNKLRKISLRKAKITAIIAPVLNLLSLIIILSVISYGFLLASNGEISIGTLVAYVTLFFQIIEPIESFGNSLAEFEGLKGTTSRIQQLLDVQETENIDDGKKLSAILSLEFKNVFFDYKHEHNILKGISFKINKGEKIALIGPSGAGKSTITYLIEQFYKNYTGLIKINDRDIQDYSLNELRNQIGYISQQNYILPDNIRNNLNYPNENISDNDILRIANQTNFLPLLKTLDKGLDTFLGSNGVIFSEGQKQRLAITRELLKDKSLFLLDEITSALDSESEHIIQETLENMLPDKITLIIAHRLSTIKNVDKIIFLEGGTITGFGSHKELLKSHKRYADFVKFQFKGLECEE